MMNTAQQLTHRRTDSETDSVNFEILDNSQPR